MTGTSALKDFPSSPGDDEQCGRGDNDLFGSDFQSDADMEEARSGDDLRANSISISEFDIAENYAISRKEGPLEHDRFIPHRLPNGSSYTTNFEKKEFLFSSAQFDCKHSVGE